MGQFSDSRNSETGGNNLIKKIIYRPYYWKERQPKWAHTSIKILPNGD